MEKKVKKIKQDKDKKVKKPVKKSSLLEIPIFNLKGEEEKKINLPKAIFSVKINSKLIAQHIRGYLANQRQGTASTKTRGEVSGSTRKIYRQKGTGRARHGDKKAPIFVGGGVVGGPKPRDFSLSLTKKRKKKALFAALSLQLKAKNILGLSSSALEMTPKTKILVQFLKSLNIYSQKIMLVFPKLEKNNLLLAASNIPNISFSDVCSLNAYQILNQRKIIFMEEALPILEKHFLKK